MRLLPQPTEQPHTLRFPFLFETRAVILLGSAERQGSSQACLLTPPAYTHPSVAPQAVSFPHQLDRATSSLDYVPFCTRGKQCPVKLTCVAELERGDWGWDGKPQTLKEHSCVCQVPPLPRSAILSPKSPLSFMQTGTPKLRRTLVPEPSSSRANQESKGTL